MSAIISISISIWAYALDWIVSRPESDSIRGHHSSQRRHDGRPDDDAIPDSARNLFRPSLGRDRHGRLHRRSDPGHRHRRRRRALSRRHRRRRSPPGDHRRRGGDRHRARAGTSFSRGAAPRKRDVIAPRDRDFRRLAERLLLPAGRVVARDPAGRRRAGRSSSSSSRWSSRESRSWTIFAGARPRAPTPSSAPSSTRCPSPSTPRISRAASSRPIPPPPN